jgi:hypothetical protein
MLTTDEREYLFRIAGEEPSPAQGPSKEVTQGIRHLLDSMLQTPAYVVSARYDILAWNRLAMHFIGDLSQFPEDNRNMIRWMFSHPAVDSHWDEPDAVAFTRCIVADLRAAYAKYPGAREVAVRRSTVKRIDHPVTGPIEFECQVLHVQDTDQRLIAYVAAPGSPAREAFGRLAAYPVTHSVAS